MSNHKKEIEAFMAPLKQKLGHEKEFLQAVEEVAETVIPYIEKHPKYKEAKILERMTQPERAISFRVPWIDDKGEFQINTGYRVQMNSAIGPYKGGMRFHPTVNLSVMKFLAFEQTLKNSLTSLPMGGGKGGSDFDPRGKSDNEIMRFCQSLMTELFRHIGADTDVPAGDIGVGAREVGFMFGQYKRLANRFTGVITGKGISWGGSLIRPEATGYGAVYFTQEVLKNVGETIKGKTVSVSGFGNVAWGVVKKLDELGAKVVTISGPDGYVYDEKGISGKKIDYMLDMRNSGKDKVKDYADKFGVEYFAGKKPWGVKVDIAMPCATQNEIDENDAKELIKNGVHFVSEVANMPTTLPAYKLLKAAGVIFAPGKAVNAGGVATSGLEMSQNSLRLSWSAKEVDEKLHDIMIKIHRSCVQFGFDKKEGRVDYVKGANIAGFVKVADAMLEQGLV
ncbi:MAG: NADP-specific glutamate dehydrogenase [Bacteroidetes bacterium]|nr:NADP-specific glutamate dehydrogenase [Bacteroidota bacterium]